jgi:signal transduction histidine kinase
LATARLRLDAAMAGHPADVAGLTADLDRMSRAISQVLAMARLDAARPDPADASVTDAARLCREVAAEFLPMADRMGRSLVVDAEAPAPAVAADLDEALRNLVSNALHHGQGTVTLCATAAEQGITISVMDEGPGVAEVDRRRLRERFAKGQSSNGSGLGLAITSAIVERAGGTLIWGENAKLELQLPSPPQPDETA